MDRVRTWGTLGPRHFAGGVGGALGLVDGVPALAEAMKGTKAMAKLEEGAEPSWRRRRRR